SPRNPDGRHGRQTCRVDSVHGIVADISKQVSVTCPKQHRIHPSPPPRICVIITRAESRQLSLWVVETSCKSERLETGIGVGYDVSKFVVIEALSDLPRRNIDNEARAAELVADDPVGF